MAQLCGLGQVEREEGPSSHKVKAGTPTLGGIGFVVTILILGLIFINFHFDYKYLALLLLFFGFAFIGLVDDLLKVFRQQNLGLTFWQKIISQAFVAAIFSVYLIYAGHHQNVNQILGLLGFAYPLLYFLLVVFLVLGTANATNLTDGLDGLLAGTGSVAFLAMMILSFRLNLVEAQTFALIVVGSVLAFLYFNFPRAKIFMGDVGALALGAGLAGLAIIMHKELRLAIIGGVFLIEALSVIIQVAFYKLYRRRIFRMTPLHHHFELLGFKESQIVVGFWVVGVILAVLGNLWL